MRRVQVVDTSKYPDAAQVKPGDRIMVRDAWGEWHERIAASELEGTHEITYGPQRAQKRKIHDFPVVWARRADSRDRIPWPAEDVRLA